MFAVWAAMTLVAGACGKGGGDEGTSTATGRTAASTPVTTAPPTTEPPPPTTTAPARTSGDRTAAASARRGAGQATASAANSPAARFTPPGRYTYASSGTFSSLLAPPRPRHGQVTITVDPPQGTDQRSVRQGPDLFTEQVMRVQQDGTYLVGLEQTFMGVHKAFRFEPPALALPYPATVGRSWSWTAVSTDGRTTADATLRVARTETVSVGGRSVEAVVVEVNVVTRGDLVATTSQQLWVAQHRLPVRQQEVTDGRLGAVSFHSESTDVLQSLEPR